jgi:hypothetical protein
MAIEIGNNRALTVVRPSAVIDVLDITRNNTDGSLTSKRQGKLIFPKGREPESLSNWEKGSFVDYYT